MPSGVDPSHPGQAHQSHPMRRACITGGAGFIGSTLADRLIEMGVEVVIVDDFTHGRAEFVAPAVLHPGVRLLHGDVLDPSVLEDAFDGCDQVFHLQANADVRRGLDNPQRDLEQNTIATSTVLEAMRACGVSRIAFASSGSVYGECPTVPTPEDAPFPIQTSLYGASKLAGEGLISAYCSGFGFTGVICRFVSILGERYTHGHLFDFYCALQRDPSRLLVQGDGRQQKSYLYVQDCIGAILIAAEHHRDEPGAFIYNIGSDEIQTVDDSIAMVVEHLGLSPKIEYTGGSRGWVGDSPLIHLDVARISKLGWQPSITIKQAAMRTLTWFDANAYAWREAVQAGALR
jgi:UDP-glucose 4-epimerase